MSTMISAVAWVPRGAAKAIPVVHEPTEEELVAARELAAQQQGAGDDEEDQEGSDDGNDAGDASSDEDMEGGGEQQALARARAAAAAMSSGRPVGGSSGMATDSIEAAMRELDMDNYDDSDDEPNIMARIMGGKTEVAIDPDGDPYITLGEDEDSEDGENFNIKPTDLLILAAKNEDDLNSLEVWVYEETDAQGEGNLYVHHDILLPSFPLCVAWLDCSTSGSAERSNVAAIGTMEPGIELWDLDVVDAVEPAATLGGEAPPEAAAAEGGSSSGGKKKKVRCACSARAGLLVWVHTQRPRLQSATWGIQACWACTSDER